MPVLEGRDGITLDVPRKRLVDIATDMRKVSKRIGKKGAVTAEKNLADMYFSDAEKMWNRADDVARGLIDIAAHGWRGEDTFARDQYPFSFLKLLRQLGYITRLRGYPGDK